MFSPSFTGTIIILFFDFKCLMVIHVCRVRVQRTRNAGAKLLLFVETAKLFSLFFSFEDNRMVTVTAVTISTIPHDVN